MEPVILILIALALVVGAAAALVVTRRRGSGVELEPPSTPTIPTAPPVPVEPSAEEREGGAAVVVEEPPAPAPVVEAPPKRPSLRDRLAKARSTFSGFLGRTKIDQDTWDDLEEALIRADLGIGPATELLEHLQARVKAEGLETGDQLVGVLKDEMKSRLGGVDRSLTIDEGRTNVWLFVGVNGVGKTTTIGKLGKRQSAAGHRVVMAAGDTFRAAAAEQLGTWADRAGADLVRGAEGGDPSAIIFDAIESAAAKGADLVLADTAGRLHTKSNLMEELKKVRRVADRDPGHVTEVLLVIDATTGQNGLVQARQFTEATEVTGVVLTKLDGSAKGGIVFAIQSELGIPVKLVGLGETADDLVDFDPDEFVDALFSA
jgi:fused signal recognition particle receptor